jgi:hypothetical protein
MNKDIEDIMLSPTNQNKILNKLRVMINYDYNKI